MQVYRPRFLGGKTIPNHYGPLISQKCGSTEIKLRRNLAKLYTARSFDNHDPLTSWANGPFAIRKDRVLRAAEITTGDELQQKYKVEHNFFYSTSLGGLTGLGDFRTNSATHTKLSGLTETTAYRYHWLKFTTPSNGQIFAAEVEFYESPIDVTGKETRLHGWAVNY